MNDEIKEILDKLKETADYPKINYSSYDKSFNETIDNVAMIKSFACKQLLDYITNLQQQYEGAILIGKELNKENKKLKEAYERLTEDYVKKEYIVKAIENIFDEVKEDDENEKNRTKTE